MANLPTLEASRIPSLPPSFYYIPNFLSIQEEATILQNVHAAPWVQLSRRRLQVYPSQLTSRNVLLASKPLPAFLKEPVLGRFAELGIFSNDEESPDQPSPNQTSPNQTSSHTSPSPSNQVDPSASRTLPIDQETTINETTPRRNSSGVNSPGPDSSGVSGVNSPRRNFSSVNSINQGHAAPNHVLVNAYSPGEGIMPHEDGPAYTPVTATVSLGAPIVLDIYEKTATGERAETPRWRILQEERSLLVTRGGAYSAYLHGIREVDVDEGLGPVDGGGMHYGGTTEPSTDGEGDGNGDENEYDDGDKSGAGNRNGDAEKRKGIINWDQLGDKARFESGSLPRQERVSLTYRDVVKVSTLGNKLFGAGKR